MMGSEYDSSFSRSSAFVSHSIFVALDEFILLANEVAFVYKNISVFYHLDIVIVFLARLEKE